MVEGAGIRYCIWVQGCPFNCVDCANEEFKSVEGGKLFSTDEIIEDIKNADVFGVTFLGGEPFYQSEALSVIAEEVQKSGKNVITFTGYKYEDLIQKNDRNRLLKYTDLLIDGEYISHKTENCFPLTGSSNQRYIYLSDKLKSVKENNTGNLELRIHKNGLVEVNGMANLKDIDRLMRGVW